MRDKKIAVTVQFLKQFGVWDECVRRFKVHDKQPYIYLMPDTILGPNAKGQKLTIK